MAPRWQPPAASTASARSSLGNAHANHQPGPRRPQPETLQSIAAELGYLPLALEQAAAYIQYTVIEPTAYVDRLRRIPARMFALSAPAQEADEPAN